MATLDFLKRGLRAEALEKAWSQKLPLSDKEYSTGFDILAQGSGWKTYRDFIVHELPQLISPLFSSRTHISVLEIGPGPKSLLGDLPSRLKQRIRRYTAFEPNSSFAARLEDWLYFYSETESPLPCLERPADIRRIAFVPEENIGGGPSTATSNDNEKYDVILFCHGMHGMKPRRRAIERALEMLVECGIVAVFHHSMDLHLDGLVCRRAVSSPTGVIRVADDDKVLDCFAPLIAGFVMTGEDARAKWREVCRKWCSREEAQPGHLLFSSPHLMLAFTHHATSLPELTAQVPLVKGNKAVKNWEASLHRPASFMRPTEVQHIQQCIRWALKHEVSLTVVGGGHSGHCLWPNVVSIDMGAFNQVHILTAGEDGEDSGSDSGCLVVAEAGCKTGDIIRKTMAAGVTVPLGARPSVGAGLWLQGGIGHLARLHGLACDAIVGAVIISVSSGQVLCVGRVPIQRWPAGGVRPENEADLLWATKGAGTNFGIVVSVTFKAYAAPTYITRNWLVPLSDKVEAHRLNEVVKLVAGKLPRNCSADAYLYGDANQLHLGVTMIEARLTIATSTPESTSVRAILGPEDELKTVDGVGLFETDMYVSRMHGGHGGGKTSSFKRCLLLKNIEADLAHRLVIAVKIRPSRLCYLHLLQGGGAVSDVAVDATAFGCRDWDFACVIAGVWPRDQDGCAVSQSAVQWVYNVAKDLGPFSSGSYGADLGPDPRDAAMAAEAFGPNLPRLARLKHNLDWRNVLAYACPLPKASMTPKLTILLTGESCAGKDHCAGIWVSMFIAKGLKARAVSISEETKREYAAATGADISRLLGDRAYKEQHRPALTRFFQEQARQDPQLRERHFLNAVDGAADVDVLLITGMRDDAPVVTLSHLVPDSRLLDVRVQASEQTRRVRRGDGDQPKNSSHGTNDRPNSTALDYRPSFIFDNDAAGDDAATAFAEDHLLPFVHDDLQRLADMVRALPDHPRPGVEFRHVLNISQRPGGLRLCTSLLQTHFAGDWATVGAVATCEAGGLVFASALTTSVDVPLVLIREAGKLPPPTVSVPKLRSHISSLASNHSNQQRIEMGRCVIPAGASVVVIDDVLSTGNTLCAVLQLLGKAGVGAERVSVMVVAEFPFHRGRELLYQRFGGITVQSLLVFGGA